MGSPQFESLSIGERLEMRRRRRGLSRRVLANLVGRSEEWLRLVESGRSQLDSIEVVSRLAQVLQVDNPAELIDWPVTNSRESAPEPPLLRALYEVVIDHPALGIYASGDSLPDQDPAELSAAMDACRTVWTSSRHRYSRLAAELPPVLRMCRAVRWRRQDRPSAELLVSGYHLARLILAGTGSHSMAATVADRAIGTAAQLREPVLIAAGAWHVSQSLLNLSIPDASRDYALAAAARLERKGTDSDECRRLCAALRLVATRAAAYERAGRDSVHMLAELHSTAQELGRDSEVLMIPFGPVEVAIAAMEIAAQRNDTGEILRLADHLDIPDDHPSPRRVKYYIYQASAYAAQRDHAAVVLALSRAAEVSPEDLRYDPDAHRCIQHVLRRGNVIARREVRRLAALAGLG
ncbi:helix-turn-helix domain-containing protein [Nocardia sp. NPDC056064]|uniref:helix-turn-helix domain-containing protein n=1 Tax=Nocardia sp. NPDC056064 TaxID=3345701 RepID=UPI0035DC0392